MSDPTYDRDVRQYGFDIKGKNMNYGTGDCLAVYATNKEK